MTALKMMWNFSGWEWAFLIFCFHRYFRLVVNIMAHWTYRSKPKPSNPTFHSHNVTVIVPTIENNVEELRSPLESILACNPYKLILVTTQDKHKGLVKFVESLEDARVDVLCTQIANKRIQLRKAIPEVDTSITILVDDDVTWPSTILPWILAPFEDPKFGSVGVCQRVRRLSSGPWLDRCFNWLGADYIERRNFEISATHNMDGGTSCMSGRTNALRTEILKDPFFLDGFYQERWGKFHLNADDDNFITRWLVNHGWKTWIQYHPECELETTLENNPKFLSQCLRWARSNWRSNYTTLFIEKNVWSCQPWSVYLIYTATFTSLGLFTDPLFFILFNAASMMWEPSWRATGWILTISWYLFTKIVKRIGLLRRNPRDIIFIPVSILFGYVHGFIKLNALWTWNVTSWGTRADGDVNDSERMSPKILQSEFLVNPAANSKVLVRYTAELKAKSNDKHLVQSSEIKSTNSALTHS